MKASTLCLLAGVCAVAQPLTDLIRAVKSGNTVEVERLVDSATDVDIADSQGMTPLMWAANQGKGDLVQLLLSKGADAQAADAFGWTALIHAAGAGHSEAVRVLLENGADVAARSMNGTTALIAATAHFETAGILLAHGADPLAEANDGTTAMMAAKSAGNENLVRLLESTLSAGLARTQDASPTEPATNMVAALPETPVLYRQVSRGTPQAEPTSNELPTSVASPNPLGESESHTAEISVSPGGDPSGGRLLAEVDSSGRDSRLETEQSPAFHDAVGSPTVHSGDGLYLQLGAFDSAAGANELGTRLGARGHPSVLHKSPGSYLLLVGPFPDHSSAIDYRARLQEDGFESFVARVPGSGPALPPVRTAPAAYTPKAQPPAQRPVENTTAANGYPTVSPVSLPKAHKAERKTTHTQVFLQVGAFRAEGNALSFARGLTDPEHEPAVQPGSDGWYRVVLGPFADRETASAYRAKLAAQGYASVFRIQ